MRESTVERYLVQRVKDAGGMAVKIPAVYNTGFPDRLVLLPGGRIFFAELKAPGEKPRKIQEYIHGQLRSRGFRVEVIDNIGGVRRVLKEMTE